MIYFAFGSNMDAAQMMHRCPAATLLGTGLLQGQDFLINERGVATIVPNRRRHVWGVLWDLTADDEARLDRYEGVAAGVYRKQSFTVITPDKKTVSAFAYIAANRHPGSPLPGYIEQVLLAGTAHALPDEYIGRWAEFLPNSVPAFIRQMPHRGDKLIPIFVYGSLKRDFPNHRILQAAVFAGTAATKEQYALYAAGIPYVCRKPQTSTIKGEVFLVAAETLQRIDDLEGHPHWYYRELALVALGHDHELAA